MLPINVKYSNIHIYNGKMEFHIIVKTNENNKATLKLKSITAQNGEGGIYWFSINSLCESPNTQLHFITAKNTITKDNNVLYRVE